MNHVIIDKVRGVIYITLEPPQPIEVEFKELPMPQDEIPSQPIVENQLPLSLNKTYKRKEHPQPDPKILAQGGYINSKVAARLLGISISALDHMAHDGRLPVYRKDDTARLLFLLDDIAVYLNKNK